MTVAKFNQPDYTAQSQTGTGYPLALDAAIAVLAEQAAQFAVSAQDTPNLTVALRAGRIFRADRVLVAVAAQNSATLTAPVTNPRHDIVYIDATTGAVGVATGTPAATPNDPAIPTNKLPKARIRWTVGAAAIVNSMLDDLRFDAPSLDAILQYLTANSVWAIANGGTGASNAASARAALTVPAVVLEMVTSLVNSWSSATITTTLQRMTLDFGTVAIGDLIEFEEHKVITKGSGNGFVDTLIRKASGTGSAVYANYADFRDFRYFLASRSYEQSLSGTFRVTGAGTLVMEIMAGATGDSNTTAQGTISARLLRPG